MYRSWKQMIHLHSTKHINLITAHFPQWLYTMQDVLWSCMTNLLVGWKWRNHRQINTNQRKWRRAVRSEAVLCWWCDRGAACILYLKWKRKTSVAFRCVAYRHDIIPWLCYIAEKHWLTRKWMQTDSRNLYVVSRDRNDTNRCWIRYNRMRVHFVKDCSHDTLFNIVSNDLKRSTYPFSCSCDNKCIWHQKGSFCLLYKGDRENWDSDLWKQQKNPNCYVNELFLWA